MVGSDDRHPTMWAAGPATAGARWPCEVDYAQGARTIDGLDQAIVGSSVLAIGVTLLVGAFAVTRVTRRLHGTAQVARRISAGDLDARVDDPRARGNPTRPQDEVAAVAGRAGHDGVLAAGQAAERAAVHGGRGPRAADPADGAARGGRAAAAGPPDRAGPGPGRRAAHAHRGPAGDLPARRAQRAAGPGRGAARAAGRAGGAGVRHGHGGGRGRTGRGVETDRRRLERVLGQPRRQRAQARAGAGGR